MIDNQRRGAICKNTWGQEEKTKNEGNSNGCPFHHKSIPFSMNMRRHQHRQNPKRLVLFRPLTGIPPKGKSTALNSVSLTTIKRWDGFNLNKKQDACRI
jgi:hypothetical protein